MIFQEFQKAMYSQKVFSTRDIAKEWPGFNFVNLVNWQEKGYLIKLRNTWYAFPDALQSEADLYFAANRLRKPSYISLETALRYYNWIPESVFSITSITTAKPAEWSTPVGHFSYRSIKPGLFFGYQPVKSGNSGFNIAEPEKTLLDFLYFHPEISETSDFEGFRFNREEINERINMNRLDTYLALIGSPTLKKRWRSLEKYLGL
jgi:predicted transcriptional regulator of viral defense system